MDSKRRLSAVWFADIVGYTTLSRTDEPAALALVELLQTLAKTIITAHEGRVVKFIGDAVLAEFSSTDSAVRAAVALQEQYVAAAAARAQDSRLRIGVHLGEVAATPDGDLYGDGINTAARLHQEATPGQVIISEDVWRQLRQRPEFRFSSLGAVELRGISTRVEIYDVLFGAKAALTGVAGAPGGSGTPVAGARAKSPTIAALSAGAAVVLVLAALGYAAFNRDSREPVPASPPSTTVPPATVSAPPATVSAPPASTSPPPPSASAPTVPKQQAVRPPLQQSPPPTDDPKPQENAPKAAEIAPRPEAPAPKPAEPARPVPSPEMLQEASEIRALLQRLADAVSSAQPRERISALGPGAVMMAMRGLQQMKDAFGDPIQARLGRIEHIATRPDAVDVRFFLIVSGSTRRQPAPLAFTATISRGAGERTFTALRREFQQGREGRGGR